MIPAGFIKRPQKGGTTHDITEHPERVRSSQQLARGEYEPRSGFVSTLRGVANGVNFV